MANFLYAFLISLAVAFFATPKTEYNNPKFFCNFNKKIKDNKPTIGVLKDSAFQFYYPENFEALENEGANIVFISPIKNKVMPCIDALYIGGGFPEIHAKELEKNIYIKEKVKLLAESWLPIYAECGGLIYLGKSLIVDNNIFAMSGVLPTTFKIYG